MKLTNWGTTTSRRITFHPKVKDSTNPVLAIQELLGHHTSADWTSADARLVTKIYQKYHKLHAKTASEEFHRDLYETRISTYKKFCFFTRYPLRGALKAAIECSKQDAFCHKCNAMFSATGVCPPCSEQYPDYKSALKRNRVAEKVAAAWASGAPELKRKATLAARYGKSITSVFQLGAVKTKRSATLVEKYGDAWQQKLEARRQKTNLRLYKTNTPWKNGKCRCKAQATNVARYGVPHAMQNRAVFEKAMKASHRIEEHTLECGRVYKVQGYFEQQVFLRLVKRYKSKNVLTQFDKGYPEQIWKLAQTFPDFYIKSRDTYVEVKSTWTFNGTPKIYSANKAKAERLHAAGVDCRWVIYFHKGEGRTLVLPTTWWTLSKKEISSIITAFRRA